MIHFEESISRVDEYDSDMCKTLEIILLYIASSDILMIPKITNSERKSHLAVRVILFLMKLFSQSLIK